jgi:exodeoxyribonuclease VII large subunit
MDRSLSNLPELSVSELSAALRRMIEDRFGFVRVRGEISNFKGPQGSGHAYFCLKDESARIDAVIWRSTFARLKTKPEEGLEVIATGRITTYAGKSTYQIIIEALEPAGAGALLALIEERRRRLAAEGLFAEARKRPVPFLPFCIGVVTSPAGAVIRDILHRVTERFPRHVIVWPVRVQGESSAAEIAAAIEGFNALPVQGLIPRPDVLIVARGGGSLEDLMSFSEEIVVRAAAGSAIPLISAVGHETDWTLIDHAADLRAPTPTAAAEKAVPVRSSLAATLADLGRRHTNAGLRAIERRKAELRAILRILPQGESILAARRQTLDLLVGRLKAGCAKTYDRWHLCLARLSHRLSQQSPQARLSRIAERIKALGHRLKRSRLVRAELESARIIAMWRRLRDLSGQMERALWSSIGARRERIAMLAKILNALDYHCVLARGFAVVRDDEKKIMRRASGTAAGARLEIEFVDGTISAVARGGEKTTRTRPLSRGGRNGKQGSLF